jgi:PIN like domain
MTPHRRTSRKRSVASSTAKRLEAAVFYLDESNYSRVLADYLETAGILIRRPGKDVPFGTPDELWLATARAKKWIVLMRDQRVRYSG